MTASSMSDDHTGWMAEEFAAAEREWRDLPAQARPVVVGQCGGERDSTGKQPEYMDNPKACGAPPNWRWGYLPCGCRNDGYGRHVR